MVASTDFCVPITGIQADIKSVSVNDVAVQCNLMMTTSTPVKEYPPLPDVSIEESATSQDGMDVTFQDYSSPEGESMDKRGPCYLVYESSLMPLLTKCRFCGNSSNIVTKTLIGSLLEVSICCQHCLQTWEWKSQPFIGYIPAGNIMISAAILYSGSLPAKALRLFKILNCPTIVRKTFFDHQKFYLQPSVDLVWDFHQDKLLGELKKHTGLAFGGDGRSDSPGHSAKYGSYTLLELSRSKVVDFQLVQVIAGLAS